MCAFLLARPFEIISFSYVVPDAPDEWNYMAHATALAYGRSNYNIEYSSYMPLNQSVGPALMAAPVVSAFAAVDRAEENPVIYQRTRETLFNSWTGFAFPLATQIYLVIGAFLLYLTLDRAFHARYAAATTAISVVASGILFYAYRRPISSHVYEVVTGSLALFLLWRPSAAAGPASRKRWALVAAVAVMTFLVRYNDLPLAMALIWSSLTLNYSPGNLTGWIRLPAARRTAALQLGILFLVVAAIATISLASAHGEWKLWNMPIVGERLSPKPPSFYIQRLWHIFFGRDWSLFVTAPLVLLGLACWKKIGPKRTLAVPFLVALACNLALTITWGTQGSGFGYRYFVPSALPLATVGLSAWIEAGEKPRNRLLLAAAVALIPLVLVLLFCSTGELCLSEITTPWAHGWSNETYITTALSSIFREPADTWNSIVSLSGIGVVARWIGVRHIGIPPIKRIDAIRMIAVWTLPFIVGWALTLIFDRKVECRES